MIIPPSNQTLKWSVVLTGIASLALSFIFIRMLFEGGEKLILLPLIVICLFNAAGILRMTRWARITSTVMLWLIILCAVARFSPRLVDQYVANGQNPPSVSYLVITTLTVAIPCLVVLHVFRKYKDKFRKEWF